MADEAYRAVFLRVHPTGKMVLSLTTESDGKEAEYAQLVAAELGVPALDVKVVPADTDRFGRATASTPARPTATLGGDRQRDREDPRKAQLLAGVALDAPPDSLAWVNGAWVSGDGGGPTQAKTIEDLALYAHGTGALPPGRRGRPRRADRLPRLTASGRPLDLDLDLVGDLERPEQGRVRLDAPVATA